MPSKKSRDEINDNKSKVIKDRSPYVPQRDKIKNDIIIRERDDLTDKQKELINLILDKKTNIVFINGPSGSAKTFTAIYAGLLLLNKRNISDILYLRSAVESADKSLGFLPGDQTQKMSAYLIPLMDKLEELLDKQTMTNLLKENRIHGDVVNYIRGANYNAKFIIADEAQNYSKGELKTIMTRLGKYSKLVILADPSQSDLNGKSGFLPMFDLFNDQSSGENGIYCFSFTRKDIVRNGILGYILDRIETGLK